MAEPLCEGGGLPGLMGGAGVRVCVGGYVERGSQVSSQSSPNPLSPVFVPASAVGGGLGDAHKVPGAESSVAPAKEPRANSGEGTAQVTNAKTRAKSGDDRARVKSALRSGHGAARQPGRGQGPGAERQAARPLGRRQDPGEERHEERQLGRRHDSGEERRKERQLGRRHDTGEERHEERQTGRRQDPGEARQGERQTGQRQGQGEERQEERQTGPRPVPGAGRHDERQRGRRQDHFQHDTRVSSRTSAPAGGPTSSVDFKISDGTSTSDDLLLVAALRRSEATAAYQAVVDQAIISGALVRALLEAQERVDQVTLPPAGPGASGVQRRKLRSRRQGLLKGDVYDCKHRLAACHRLGRRLETRFRQREL